MKKMFNYLAAAGVLLLTQIGCGPGIQESNIPDESTPTSYTYSVSVSPYANTNAPALQSFAHGVSGDKVLLFAGRTNRTADDGGLHNMDNASNYAQTSFPLKSYNTNIYVYDLSNQSVSSISYSNLLDSLVAHYCTGIVSDSSGGNNNSSECVEYLSSNLETIFKATNPISTQDGDMLYVLGGYGAVPNDTTAYYITYNQVARISISKMIQLIEQGPSSFTSSSDWQGLLQLGQDPTYTAVSTGAEMFKIGDSIYLAGGHNFGNNQKYLDAVYPFAVATGTQSYQLNVSVGNAISDVSDPKATGSDTTSTFRRRDGPVTAALFKDASGDIIEGLTFYAGVFTPKTTAWETAIYVHPNSGGTSSYTLDAAYNQQNQSIYACSDIVAYDSTSSMVHTFLLGGIGNDTLHPMSGYSDSLSTMPLGFTNSGAHIQYDLNSNTSAAPTVLVDLFPAGQNKFYGAESTLIPTTSSDVHYVTTKGDLTEVIDLENSVYTNDELIVGYVYGGIEAYQLNPGQHGTGFGPGLSAASDKIWKVTLTRTASN